MSLNRYDTKRDANEADICDALGKVGVQTFQLDSPVDLLCWGRGVFFCIEVKDGSKIPSQRKLTPRQEKFFANTQGYPRFKVETVSEALEAASLCRSWGRSPQTKGVP